MNLLDYNAALEPLNSNTQPTAALIYVDGAIVRRDVDNGPMGESKTASAETIAQAIHSVTLDKAIKSIILRVNSPGGSVAASETIYHALMQAKAAGKYIVVSMGDTAASGGYWIAAPADKIVAEPSTLTGSIGVVGGKFVIAGLSEKLGVQWAELGTGKHSTMWSSSSPFDAEAAQKIDASMDEIYSAFTERVVKGRHLKPEQVDSLARGRVWTGKSAKDLGLVDELGGLKEAVALVKQQQGIAPERPLAIVVLPQEPSWLEKVFQAIGLSVQAPMLTPAALKAWMMGVVTHPPVVDGLYYTGAQIRG